MAFRDWLVFSRTHTAALTIPGALMGAFLADPATTPTRLALVGVWAWLAHGAGFAVNNLLDLAWDRADPNKRHHPLVSGAIQERDAWLATLLASFAALVLGCWLGRDHPASWLALWGFVGFGTLYNHQCKVSLLAPLWISVSFACIPLYAWLAMGGGWSWTILYLVAYSFLLMVAQIAVSGYAKDLACAGEVNLLRRWGAEVTPRGEWHFPVEAIMMAFVLRWALATLGAFYFALHLPIQVGALTGVAIQCVAAWVLCGPLLRTLRNGWMPRAQRVKWMGLAEILAYWFLVGSLAFDLLVAWVVGLVVAPLAYYVVANRVYWGRGHALGPAV